MVCRMRGCGSGAREHQVISQVGTTFSNKNTLEMVDFGERRTSLVTENGREQGGKPTEVTFKVLMIGDSSVGKTASLARFAEDTFPHSFISTVGKLFSSFG